MVASVVALGKGCSAELAGPEDDGRVEQPAGFQVLEQGGDGLVHGARVVLVAFLEVAVLVPAVAADGRAGQFDETHAAFDQPPRQETLASVDAGGFECRVEAIPLQCGWRFTPQIHQCRHRRLHPKGEFVVRDGGFDRVRRSQPREPGTIQVLHQFELFLLDLGGGFAGNNIGHRFRAGLEDRPLIGRGQKTAAEILDDHPAGPVRH